MTRTGHDLKKYRVHVNGRLHARYVCAFAHEFARKLPRELAHGIACAPVGTLTYGAVRKRGHAARAQALYSRTWQKSTR